MSGDRRAAEYVDWSIPRQICYRESQRQCLDWRRGATDVNRWTASQHRQCWLHCMTWPWCGCLKWLMMNVPVGDSTACAGDMSSDSWTRLSSSPTASNCISWWAPSNVTSRRVDVTDIDRGLNVSEWDFGSQCCSWPLTMGGEFFSACTVFGGGRKFDGFCGFFGGFWLTSAPADSDDNRQIQWRPAEAIYIREVCSQATMSRANVQQLTTTSASRWYVVALNLQIVSQ